MATELSEALPRANAGRSGPGRVSSRDLESLALVAGAAAFIVGAIAALIAFRLAPAPIAGPDSIGQFTAVVSALVALVCAGAGRYVAAARAGVRLHPIDHLDIVAVAVAHGVVALLGWTLLAWILAQAFLGAEVFPVAVVLLAGVGSATSAYMSFASAVALDARRLALLFGAFFALGVLAAMLSTSDPDWWRDNLSALGVTTNASARAFNLTLIVSGFLVAALARSATTRRTGAPGLRSVRVCLIALGVCLALVGAFPVNEFLIVHVSVSIGLAVAFGVLVIRLPGWVPGLARAFIVLGWLFLALMVLLGVFYAVGYYTLTAVELVGGALVFAWVILFIRSTAALEQDERA